MNEPNEALMSYVMMLRQAGVMDHRVLHAMELIPRTLFVTESFYDRAWQDTALPIGSGQTLSQPSVVGKMTQALNVGPRDKVLEIGTGSGFQSAILSQLARRVYTVERHPSLSRIAHERFEKLGLVNVTTISGDGTLGLEAQAPFDRIILTAAAEDPPSNLLAQLKMGGIMVLPVGQSDQIQTLVKVTKTEQGFDYEELFKVRFVPLVAN